MGLCNRNEAFSRMWDVAGLRLWNHTKGEMVSCTVPEIKKELFEEFWMERTPSTVLLTQSLESTLSSVTLVTPEKFQKKPDGLSNVVARCERKSYVIHHVKKSWHFHCQRIVSNILNVILWRRRMTFMRTKLFILSPPTKKQFSSQNRWSNLLLESSGLDEIQC